MNDTQKAIIGMGMGAAQSGDPLGSMVKQASDFYKAEPGQHYVQAKTFMKGEPDIVLYQRMYNEFRDKVYNGEPLTQDETDALQYLHKKLTPGYDERKSDYIESQNPTLGGQAQELGENAGKLIKGKYDDLVTRGKTTLDDIAGQAGDSFDSLAEMFSPSTETVQLELPERQPSGDIPGVLEEMRGQFPFERDVNSMIPQVSFEESMNADTEMTPERKVAWEEYMQQLLMRGDK